MKKEYSLVGVDGNVFAVMGYVSRAMRREGFSSEEIDAYYERAKSSDYDNAIYQSVVMIDKVNERLKDNG